MASPPPTDRVRRIGPTPHGRAFSAFATAMVVIGPWAVAERGFGLHRPLSNQLVIVPFGVVSAVLAWRGLRAVLHANAAVLQLDDDRLELLEPGQPAVVVHRSDVGAVIVDGDDIWGSFTVVVHDDESRVLHRWALRWPGRRPGAVVKALSAAGWPAAVGADLYDGRFLTQTEGQPPILRRPGSSR